jgi:hypothetical protein
MPTFPFNFITKSPNYDASKWPLANQKSDCNVNIVEQLKQIRHEHTILCKRLARIKNEVSSISTVTKFKTKLSGPVIERDSPRPDEENREIAEICEQP